MTKEEIKESLCYYDLRNPDNTVVYGMTKEEIKEEGYGNHKKEDCACDNCFYGRTKMAEELLKYVSSTELRDKELLNSFAEWLKEEDDHNFIGKYTVGAYCESVQKKQLG